MVKQIKTFLSSSFFKFGCVGAVGIITNNTIFFIFVDIFYCPPNLIAVLAFMLAGVQNYALNHLWTFNQVTRGRGLTILGWFKFMLSSAGGLGTSLLALNILLSLFDFPKKVIAQLCASGTGIIFNFLGSRLFVFTHKKEKDPA